MPNYNYLIACFCKSITHTRQPFILCHILQVYNSLAVKLYRSFLSTVCPHFLTPPLHQEMKVDMHLSDSFSLVEDSKNISTQECHPEEPCNQHVRYSGYMEKLPTSKSKSTVMKGWKRRFFKVMKGCIFYYEDETSKKYKGYVHLSKSDVKCDEEKCQIQVTEEKGKCLVMKVPNIDDELNKWYHALKLEAAQPT